VPLKANVDEALGMPRRRHGDRAAPHRRDVAMVEGRDVDWATAVATQPPNARPRK
jgi:hypothetical protein